MFDLDFNKMLIFGVVAVVVVGPKDLPVALRAAGRIWTKLQRVRSEIRSGAEQLMADAALGDFKPIDIAVNPTTAMRGRLIPATADEASSAAADAPEYASPEMRAYLTATVEPEGDALERATSTQGVHAAESVA